MTPPLVLCVAAAVVWRAPKPVAVAIAWAALGAAVALTFGAAPPDAGWVADRWAAFLTAFCCAATALALAMAAGSPEVPPARMGAFAALLLLSAGGLSLSAMAADWVPALLGLEVAAVTGSLLAGFRADRRASAEAGAKALLSGAVATGLGLTGAAWLCGITGTTAMPGAGALIDGFLSRTGPAGMGAVLAALGLVLAGVGFRVAAAPWHMWAPDVVEGAPTPFAAFVAVAPVAAGVGLLFRIGDWVLVGVPVPWGATVGAVAALTMTWGNVAALTQTGLKRMLAYGAMAQAGWALMGVAAASPAAVAIALAALGFLGLGAFLAVGVVSRAHGEGMLPELQGLGRRSPFTALALALFLFALAGMPPLGGFVAKLYLVRALVEGGARWQIALALCALLNGVIALSCCVRVVRAMYVDHDAVGPVDVRWSDRVLLAFFAVGVVAFGRGADALARVFTG